MGFWGGDTAPPHLPPTPQKNRRKYFSGNYHVIFGHFPVKYHVKFGHFVNFFSSFRNGMSFFIVKRSHPFCGEGRYRKLCCNWSIRTWTNWNSGGANGGARLRASQMRWERRACDFTKKIFFYANGWIATELTHDGPQTGLHRERWICGSVQCRSGQFRTMSPCISDSNNVNHKK